MVMGRRFLAALAIALGIAPASCVEKPKPLEEIVTESGERYSLKQLTNTPDILENSAAIVGDWVVYRTLAKEHSYKAVNVNTGAIEDLFESDALLLDQMYGTKDKLVASARDGPSYQLFVYDIKFGEDPKIRASKLYSIEIQGPNTNNYEFLGLTGSKAVILDNKTQKKYLVPVTASGSYNLEDLEPIDKLPEDFDTREDMMKRVKALKLPDVGSALYNGEEGNTFFIYRGKNDIWAAKREN